MKRLLSSLVIVLLSTLGFSQGIINNPNPGNYGTGWHRGYFDSLIFMPAGCGVPTEKLHYYNEQGDLIRLIAIKADTCNKHIYWYTPVDSSWNQLDGGGGGGDDSALMASKYYVDTAKINLRNSILLKLNITDTATKWVNNIGMNASNDSLIWLVGATRHAVKLPTGGSGVTPSNVVKQNLNGFGNFVNNLTDSIPEGPNNKYFHNSDTTGLTWKIDSLKKAADSTTIQAYRNGVVRNEFVIPTPGGAQNLTATQNATNYNIAISGGNSQNLLPATTNLAGLLDTARARHVDSSRNHQLIDTTRFIVLGAGSGGDTLLVARNDSMLIHLFRDSTLFGHVKNTDGSWTFYVKQIDTTNILNFSAKVRALFHAGFNTTYNQATGTTDFDSAQFHRMGFYDLRYAAFGSTGGSGVAKTYVDSTVFKRTTNSTPLFNRGYFTSGTGLTFTGLTPTYVNGAMRLNAYPASFSSYFTINGLVSDEEDHDMEMVFRIDSIPTNLYYGMSIGKVSVNPWFPISISGDYDFSQLSLSGTAMKIGDGIGLTGADSISWQQMGALPASGDIIKAVWSQRGGTHTWTYQNITAGTPATTARVIPNMLTAGLKNFYSPNTGNYCVWLHGGKYDILSLKVTSVSVQNPKIITILDSKGILASAGEQLRWVKKIESLGTVTNFCGISDRTVEAVQVLPYIKSFRATSGPQYAFICIGRNDLASSVSSAIWQPNYTGIRDSLVNWGYTVIHILPIPEGTQNQSTLKTFITTTFSGDLMIDPSTGWDEANMAAADSVHENTYGHAYIANLIINSGYIPAKGDVTNQPAIPIPLSSFNSIAGITGSGSAGQIPIWLTGTSQTSSANFLYGTSTKQLNLNFDGSHTIALLPSSTGNLGIVPTGGQLNLGNATIQFPLFSAAYPLSNGIGGIYGIGGTVNTMGILFQSLGTYGGTSGNINGSAGTFYDYQATAYRGGYNVSGKFYWGPSATSFTFSVPQPGQGPVTVNDSLAALTPLSTNALDSPVVKHNGNFYAKSPGFLTAPGAYTAIVQGADSNKYQVTLPKLAIAMGAPQLQTATDLTSQTSAQTSFCSFTTSADGTFQIGAYIHITSISLDVIQMQVSWTDETSTNQSANFYTQGSTSPGQTIVGVSSYPIIQIRAKSGTVINISTVLTTGTGSIAYNCGGTITKLY